MPASVTDGDLRQTALVAHADSEVFDQACSIHASSSCPPTKKGNENNSRYPFALRLSLLRTVRNSEAFREHKSHRHWSNKLRASVSLSISASSRRFGSHAHPSRCE